MAERAPKDAILDLLGLGSGEAEAAPWEQVAKLLKKLGPEAWKALDKPSKAALEMLTEEYPSIRNARLSGPATMSELTNMDRIFKSARYQPNAARYFSPEQYALGSYPAEITVLPMELRKQLGSKFVTPNSSVSLSYGHEAGHALTGGSSEYNKWLGAPRDASIAPVEGFAEGVSHGMLGKYNKNVVAPYWKRYKGTPAEDYYLTGGTMGVEAGDMMRRGKAPKQDEIIKLMMDIILKAWK